MLGDSLSFPVRHGASPNRDFYPDEELRPEDVAEEAGEYLCLGENHSDPNIAIEVVIPLLETGEFDCVFLESLLRGSFEERGEELKKEEESVYEWNKEKYDMIVETAVRNGVEVHGLDAWGEREDRGEEVHEWKEYMLENSGDKNLVLLGSTHLFDSFNLSFDDERTRGDNLSDLLRSEGREVTTMAYAKTSSSTDRARSLGPQMNGLRPGIHRVLDLPPLFIREDDPLPDFIHVY